MFRAANVFGGLISPLFGAAMFAWGRYMAAFMYVGAGYLILLPFIYLKLYAASDLYLEV